MIGDRALALLTKWQSGGRPNATRDERKALVKSGFVVVVPAGSLERIRRYEALDFHAEPDGYRSAGDVAEELAAVEGRLRSDWHRMISFAATLRAEEERRAQLRSLLGVRSDPEAWAELVAHHRAIRQTPRDVTWLREGDEVSAITELGWRAAVALHTRYGRFADAPLEDFVRPFLRAERGMERLGQSTQALRTALGSFRGSELALVGLLKTGLPPQDALGRWRAATNRLPRQGLMAVERPHLAVAMVRIAGAGPLDAADRQLVAANRALRHAGFPETPVVRALGRLVAAAGDPGAGAERLRRLAAGIGAAAGDEGLKAAGRMLTAPGSADEVLVRYARAVKGGHAVPVSATLAACSSSVHGLELLADRWRELGKELVERRAFRAGRVPASAVELVAVGGTPKEVVETVRQLVAHLPAYESPEQWGVSTDWPAAVAFARRFAW